MTPRLAIGIGCRRGTSGESIAALVREALGRVSTPAEAVLYCDARKAREPGIAEAARLLGLSVLYLDPEILASVSDRVRTRSARVEALFGVPSVAEAAALAGAGPEGRLIVERIQSADATCAVASADLSAPRPEPIPDRLAGPST